MVVSKLVADSKRWTELPWTAKQLGVQDGGFIVIPVLDGLLTLHNLYPSHVVVHEAYAKTGHATNSFHYRGMAIDFHIIGLSLLDQFLLAERIPQFTAIGMYPHWKNPGLHCDVREVAVGKLGPRWFRHANGQYVYKFGAHELIQALGVGV